MREASLRIEILDHQVADSEGLPFGRVDDVELDLSVAAGEEPRVTRMLCGQEPLGERLGGLTGGCSPGWPDGCGGATASRSRRTTSRSGSRC